MTHKPLAMSLKISATYAVLSGLWIIVSDRALALLVTAAPLNLVLQTWKGWGFVVVTAVLLFITLRSRLRGWESESLGRREAEAALVEQEKRYRTLVQNLAVGVITVDESENILFANPAAEIVFAGTKANLTGMNLKDFMNAEEFRKVREQTERRSRGETSTYEVEITRLDGEACHVQITAAPQYDASGAFAGALATFHDVTERTHLEQRVEEERAQLLTLINNLPDRVYLKDRDSRFILANRVVAELVGVRDQEELIGKTDHDLYPKEMADEFRADERKVMEGSEPMYDKLVSHVVEGKTRWNLTTKVPIVDREGRVRGLVGLSRDITDSKAAEEALLASERRYQSIVENLNDSLIVHDFNGIILDVNEHTCRMHGYPREEMIGRNLVDMLDEEGRESFPGMIEAIRKSGSLIFEATNVRKDGTKMPVEVSVKVVTPEGRGTIQAFVRDLTERRKAQEEQHRLQEELQAAQKMEAVGRLAGGVAHDFNNLLTVINGYCELGLARTGTEDPLREDLSEIKRAARRAAALTSQLLAFSRRQILQPRVLDLGGLVDGMTDMLERLLGEDVEIRMRASPRLWRIRADPGRLEQVVMNLAVNSRDAMPDGGRLTIEASNAILDEDFRREHPEVKLGDYVLLAVSDTGVGMDAATQGRLFEPFFTTKEKGKGTGLGLATVYGIVKQSDGYIFCISEPGVGTTFRIYFPRVVADPEHHARSRGGSTDSPKGSETILLVEDDNAVRRITASILEGGGYRVISEGNGAVALERLLASGAGPDLLVSDVVMPGIDGKEVARTVTARFPGTRVLFISGYAENSIVHQGVLEEGVELIPKPFTATELLVKVRALLDRPAPAAPPPA